MIAALLRWWSRCARQAGAQACTVVLLGAWLAQVPGCQRAERSNPLDERVVLQVNDRTVTLGEFEREFARTNSEYVSRRGVDTTILNELKSSLLSQLIERSLLLEQAERHGITLSSDELEGEIARIKEGYPSGGFDKMLVQEMIDFDEWKEKLARKLLMDKTVRQVLDRDLKVTDEEVRGYYEANRQSMKRPEKVRARHILVSGEGEALEIKKRLMEGADFAALARQRSLSPDREAGGDLGFFERGQMPKEFDETVFNMVPGEISDIVRSPYGCHIFQLIERRPPHRPSYEEVQAEVRETMLRRKREAAYEKWYAQLKAQAVIKTDLPLLFY